MTTVIIGAGIGGLSAAIVLAAAGEQVTLLEKEKSAGGKLRPVIVDGEGYDGCATVMTMSWVFEELFALAKSDFIACCPMKPLETYARHYWSGGACLDLHADRSASRDAVRQFAGTQESDAYVAFMQNARAIHDSLKQPFMNSQRPTPLKLARSLPFKQLLRINPFETLASALKKQFTDPRLVQLFGRYATYCGSSPFTAPATLMLIAHVEAEGVWRLQGGMAALPEAMKKLAENLGVAFQFNAEVRYIQCDGSNIAAVVDSNSNRVACDSIIMNGDPNAVAVGLFGDRAAIWRGENKG